MAQTVPTLPEPSYQDHQAALASYSEQQERESRAPRHDVLPAYPVEREEPVYAAQARTSTAVRQFFDMVRQQRLSRMVIAVTPGVGKTYVTLEQAIAMCGENPAIRIEIAEPTKQKCMEVYQDLLMVAGAVQIHLVRGRCPENCERFDAVKEVEDLGVTNISQSVCGGCPLNPRNGGNCAYYTQLNAAAEPGITVYPNAYLSLPRPRTWPAPVAVIVDESPEQVDKAEIPIVMLRARLPIERAVVAALAAGQDRRRTDLTLLSGLAENATREEKVAAAKVRVTDLLTVRTAARKKALDGLVALSRDEEDPTAACRKPILAERVRRNGWWIMILNTLLADLVRGWDLERVRQDVLKDEATGADKTVVRVVTKKALPRLSWQNPTRPHESPAEPRPLPVMLLDGTANLALLEDTLAVPGRIGGEVEMFRADAALNAVVIQVDDTMGSAYSLLSDEGRDKLTDLVKLATAKTEAGKRVVIFTANKKVAAAIRKILGEDSPIDIEEDVHHAGGVAGMNKWKDHNVVILAGLPRPPHEDAEDVALALYGTVDRFEGSIEDMPQEWRGYRMANGSAKGVLVPVHPDPVVDAIWQHMINAAAVQAIHRIRPVRTHDGEGNLQPIKEVFIFTKLPLDLTVTASVPRRDFAARAADMATGSLTGAWKRSDGFLPLTGPALFATGAYASVRAARLCPDAAKIRAALDEIGVKGMAQDTLIGQIDGAGAGEGIVTSVSPSILINGAADITPGDPANAVYVVKARKTDSKGGRDSLAFVEAQPGLDMTSIPRQQDAAGNEWVITQILTVLTRLSPAEVVEIEQRAAAEIIEQHDAAVEAERRAADQEGRVQTLANLAEIEAQRPAKEDAIRLMIEEREAEEARKREEREAIAARRKARVAQIAVGRLVELAARKFGSREKAELWMRISNLHLGGRTPAEFAAADYDELRGTGPGFAICARMLT